MMTLIVRSERCETHPKLVNVHWHAAATKTGVVRVTVEPDVSDIAVAAELGAVHWLLTEKHVLGKDRTGNGIKLVFSRGAVKKLLRKESAKHDLAIYARHLMTRFKNATIEVSKDAFEHAQELILDHWVMQGPQDVRVFSPRIGWVNITTHSIEQYANHSNSGPILDPYPSLVRRLKNPDLIPYIPPKRVLEHKLAKYGPNQEFWTHPSDSTTYTVVPQDDGSKTLVTVSHSARWNA